MACSSPSCNLFFNRPSPPIPTSAPGCSLSFSNSIFYGYHAIYRHGATSTSRIRSKFEKFQGEPPQDSFREAEPSSALENFEDDEEDDRTDENKRTLFVTFGHPVYRDVTLHF